ncbi:hypothetical protein [Pseudomonas sp. 8O]|uniref:hypothetical protein n=1 Tax=Pseudomonas sp. 8O TaxID=2653165 RepID=UPI00135B30E5|nr:hypothetical protein [Pseudomonas sp. 8O]
MATSQTSADGTVKVGFDKQNIHASFMLLFDTHPEGECHPAYQHSIQPEFSATAGLFLSVFLE